MRKFSKSYTVSSCVDQLLLQQKQPENLRELHHHYLFLGWAGVTMLLWLAVLVWVQLGVAPDCWLDSSLLWAPFPSEIKILSLSHALLMQKGRSSGERGIAEWELTHCYLHLKFQGHSKSKVNKPGKYTLSTVEHSKDGEGRIDYIRQLHWDSNPVLSQFKHCCFHYYSILNK